MLRFMFIGILLCFIKFSYCQVDSFSINGSIKGVDNGYVQIWQPKADSSFYVSSYKVRIHNGEFNIKGHLAFPHITVLIIFDDENNIFETDWFFIDVGNQHLNINIKNEGVHLTSTAKSYNEYASNYKPTIDSLNLIRRNINHSLYKYRDSLDNHYLIDSLNQLQNVITQQKDSFLLDYVIENPRSYIGQSELLTSLSLNGSILFYETVFSFIDEDLKQNSIGLQILEQIKHLKRLKEGSVFPSFELLDTNKVRVSLYQKKLNTYTLIDFWFHNCGSCIEQFPEFKEIYKKYHNKGFEIIGITVDKEKYELNWKKEINKQELSWPQLWDFNGDNCSKYLISFFPTNFLLNANGEIIEKNIDLKKLNDFLNKNL